MLLVAVVYEVRATTGICLVYAAGRYGVSRRPFTAGYPSQAIKEVITSRFYEPPNRICSRLQIPQPGIDSAD